MCFFFDMNLIQTISFCPFSFSGKAFYCFTRQSVETKGFQ